MNTKDKKYQNAVDRKSDELIQVGARKLLELDDFSLQVENGIEIGIWNWGAINGERHIVFQAERSFLLIFKKKYLSGLVVLKSLEVRKMVQTELANYD